MQKKLSIIIPVYNLENYLEECLKSIENQNFNKNSLEVLIVNDGSYDSSERIIDKYCARNNYMKKLNKKNGGVSSSRNLGIDNAKGEYIAFWDGDDYVSENSLEKIINYLETEKADIFIYNYIELYNEEKKFIKQQLNNNNNVIKDYLLQNIKNYPWNKIYKTELLKNNDIKFPENEIYEDMYFTLKIIISAKKIIYIKDELYIYRIRAGSLSRCHNDKNLHDYLKNFMKCYKILEEKNYNKLYKEEFEKYCVENLINIHVIKAQINSAIKIPVSFSIYNLIRNKKISNKNKFIYKLVSTNLYMKYKKVKTYI